MIRQRKQQKPVNRRRKPTSVRRPKQQTGLNPVVNAAARTLGGAGSSLLGFGPGIGNMLGDSAHKLFKQITGYGEYKVASNSLQTNNGAPLFKPSDRSTRIRHREFITDIKSYGPDFRIFNQQRINPANAALFPWLSQVAPNYQQFKFHGLVFSFESKSGTAVGSTNTSLGSVIMSTLYNIYDLLPNDKQTMEALEFTTSCIPSANMIHPIECSPKEQVLEHLYIAPVQGAGDLRFSNMGKFIIAVVGQQAAPVPTTPINLGELWVSYDVEFLKPHKPATKTDIHISLDGPSIIPAMWFGAAPFIETSSLEIEIDAPASIITFPPSYFGDLEVVYASNTGGPLVAFGAPTITPIGNVTLLNAYLNDTASLVAPICAATDSAVLTFAIRVNGGGSFSMTGGTPLVALQGDMYITQL